MNTDFQVERFQRSFAFGQMEIRQWELPDVLLGHARVTYNRQDWLRSQREHDDVQLHFGIRGNYDFRHTQLDQNFSLQAGHYNLMFSEGIGLEVYNHSLEIETFGVRYQKETFLRLMNGGSDSLSRFCEDICAGKSSLLYPDFLPLSLQMERLIREVLHSPYTGRLQKVFLLSKSLELLVLQAEAYESFHSRNEQFIRKASDRERLVAAKALVQEHLQAPLSLPELAKEVGLNEYKLKKGFKELFGTTVFAYLSQKRLEQAGQLLRDTQQNAQEIAFHLGYATPQHFHRAFKQYFGVTPGQYRR